MKMTAFRVQNYRSVVDSGWVNLSEVTVIVGKNESGKTSLMRALWKFNPFSDVGYDPLREWPRGYRRAMTDDSPVTSVRFVFMFAEQQALAAIDDCLAGLTGVEITRNYRGDYSFQFLPRNPEGHYNQRWIFNVIRKHFDNTPRMAMEYMKAGYRSVLETLTRHEPAPDEHQFVVQHDAELPTLPDLREDQRRWGRLGTAMKDTIDGVVTELITKPPARQAVELVHRWMPTFVYMDDYRVFTGAAHLDKLYERQQAGRLTDDDRTVLLIMEMAGLQLEDEVRKGALLDREQRMLDMSDASKTLTAEIAHRWSQKRYEVMFQADGQHFVIFVKDLDTNVLVSLEERSRGFQWFFSFDMNLMYESQGRFENAVLLLDEPGLHLHAAAQRDILARIRAYAQRNQLIYTTHQPFMIDFTHLEQVLIAEDHGTEGGTRLHTDWASAGRDARFTLQAALGLAWSQSLLSGNQTLVVESVTDYWLLAGMSALLEDAGKTGLDSGIVVTPAGGAHQVTYVGSLLHDRPAHSVMLLNAAFLEGEGDDVHLVQQWQHDEGRVVRLDTTCGLPPGSTLEDLLPLDYYLAQVNLTYHRELEGQLMTLDGHAGLSLLARVNAALAARGLAPCQRERVARGILRDLARKHPADFPATTLDQFARLCAAINEAMRR